MKFLNKHIYTKLLLYKALNFFFYSKYIFNFFFLDNFNFSSNNEFIFFKKLTKKLNRYNYQMDLTLESKEHARSTFGTYFLFRHKINLTDIKKNFFFSMNFENINLNFKLVLDLTSVYKLFSKRSFFNSFFIIKPKRGGYKILSLGVLGFINLFNLFDAFFYNRFLFSFNFIVRNNYTLFKFLIRKLYITFYKVKNIKKLSKKFKFFSLKKQKLIKKGRKKKFNIIFSFFNKRVMLIRQLRKILDTFNYEKECDLFINFNLLLKLCLYKFFFKDNANIVIDDDAIMFIFNDDDEI